MYARAMNGHLNRQFSSAGTVTAAGELLAGLADSQRDALVLSVADGAAVEASAAALLKKVAALRELLVRLPADSDGGARAAIEKKLAECALRADALVTLARKGQADPAAHQEVRQFVATRFDPLCSETGTIVRQLMADQQRIVRETHDSDTKTYHQAVLSLMVLLGFFIVCGAGVGLIIASSINASLRLITTRVHDISEGEGDLTQRIDIIGSDEISEVGGYINNFIEKVRKIVIHSVETATETEESSTELSEMANLLSDNVARQNQMADESNHLMADVAENLDVTEEMAVTTTETLEETQRVLAEFVATLNEVGGTVIAESGRQADLAGRMKTLTEQASSIYGVLGIISDIADQTNLLALNASIEAARAGESGRGFAVVADEVRNLASKTQNSLNEINRNVRSVVEGIENLYSDTASSSQQMEEVSNSTRVLLENAGSTSERLSGSVETSSSLVMKTTYIATRTKSLIETMNNLVELSSQTQMLSVGVGMACNSMAEKSEELNESLHHFKV